MGYQSEVEKLNQAIQTLEAQRQILGDAVLEAALAPLREKLTYLQASFQGEQCKLVRVLFSDLECFIFFLTIHTNKLAQAFCPGRCS